MREYDRLFIDKQSPDAYRSMSAVASAVAGTAKAAGLDQLLVELVNIRISQLNGCGFCLDLHVRQAVKNGETPQRLAVLPAWRDVELFSPTEQAALALAEAITMRARLARGVLVGARRPGDQGAQVRFSVSWLQDPTLLKLTDSRVSVCPGEQEKSPGPGALIVSDPLIAPLCGVKQLLAVTC